MKTNNQIQCPVCGTPIEFDIYGLLRGYKFQCPNCCASISLSEGSSEMVRNAMDRLDKLKTGQVKLAE